ncbi:MAG TPA: zinc-binding dehydrogenase, partial [Roseovarius nubinhibens]|nr:zinc-binding dehydrogenase [Roseovarius nubinhibens]
PEIDRILPPDAAAEAHEAVMTPGRAGAVLLDMR